MNKKGNKKMHTPRQKIIHNHIPTSLFMSLTLSRWIKTHLPLPTIVALPQDGGSALARKARGVGVRIPLVELKFSFFLSFLPFFVSF